MNGYTTRWCGIAPFLTGLLCLFPLLLFWDRFNALYWFGDDWDLTSALDKFGLLSWMWQPFAENFQPLFKAGWFGAIWLFNGSYTAMILILWAAHGGILWLTIPVMRHCDFCWLAQCLAVLTIGMSWSNIETLCWATQWSALLATFFLMLGLLFVL
jgi:hypothetical protein